MKAQKRGGHSAGSRDRWLVSYADFITLLFAFFVVMFATSQADKKKQAEMASSMASAFDRMGLFDQETKHGLLANADAAGANGVPWALVKKRIEDAAGPEILTGAIGLTETTQGLTISLREARFFDSGSAEIRASALPVVDRIAAALPETALRVEGHTDDVPIHTQQYASNWELSSARASDVARLLLKHDNVHGEKLSVSGYAEFHPVADNATEDGRARNRRVDIVVLAPK